MKLYRENKYNKMVIDSKENIKRFIVISLAFGTIICSTVLLNKGNIKENIIPEEPIETEKIILIESKPIPNILVPEVNKQFYFNDYINDFYKKESFENIVLETGVPEIINIDFDGEQKVIYGLRTKDSNEIEYVLDIFSLQPLFINHDINNIENYIFLGDLRNENLKIKDITEYYMFGFLSDNILKSGIKKENINTIEDLYNTYLENVNDSKKVSFKFNDNMYSSIKNKDEYIYDIYEFLKDNNIEYGKNKVKIK